MDRLAKARFYIALVPLAMVLYLVAVVTQSLYLSAGTSLFLAFVSIRGVTLYNTAKFGGVVDPRWGFVE